MAVAPEDPPRLMALKQPFGSNFDKALRSAMACPAVTAAAIGALCHRSLNAWDFKLLGLPTKRDISQPAGKSGGVAT
jgi:hypothetical protein